MKSIILTGDRPTGPLHLGHYVGSLQNRVQLQSTCDQYLIIADAQAMTDHFDDPDKVRNNVLEIALDYLAVGLDPKKNTFFIQSQIPELFELTCYFLNLVSVSRLARNPTVKTELRQKGLEQKVPAGFLCYPVSQAADILAFDADLVPAGEDQNPIIELTNEIGKKFNSVYQISCFKEVRSFVGEIGRLPGTDGDSKMSKSLGNAIFLSDSTDEIRRKVQSMYTDPNHIRIEDPGVAEGNVVFKFLDFFDLDKSELEELKSDYRRGGLGDGILKKRLVEILDQLIAPIRQQRLEFKRNLPYVQELLKIGTQVAREKVQNKMNDVKKAMKLAY